MSTVQEMKAHKRPALQITHLLEASIEGIVDSFSDAVQVPKSQEYFGPIMMLILLQLLGYQIAIDRACDVDQPRYLVKSALLSSYF
jgi:glucosamine--fructose-6-phosphate aminotransferase (isomerizing)